MYKNNNQLIIKYKALLYDFFVYRQKLIVKSGRWEQEWLKVVSSLFHTDRYELLCVSGSEGSCSGKVISEQELNLLRASFQKPYLREEEIHRNLPFIQGMNAGFQLICEEELVEAYLFLDVESSFLNSVADKELLLFVEESVRFSRRSKDIDYAKGDEERYKELFNVTEKFHSSMNIEYVLGEILSTLQRVFPAYTYSFLLAIDDRYRDLPIEHFNFDLASEEAMASYIGGIVQLEVRSCDQSAVLYAPLKGKQGVYGVLQVNVPNQHNIQEDEKEFIRILANTGGSAIEKAKLYEQSRRLITDLQLINETSHQLNSSVRFSDTTQFLQQQISTSFGAAAVGFVFLKDGEYEVLPGSSELFQQRDGEKYVQYIVQRIIVEKESIFIGKLDAKLEDAGDYQSLMAVPMVEGERLKGFCIVLKTEPYGFTFEMYKLLQSLIHHSTLALSNAMLREELEKLVVTDHLTKLYSRNYLDECITGSMNKDGQGAFLLIDIDNFKQVNDTHGHQVGDEIIIQVADLMREHSAGEDIAARWGGEELAIYLPGRSLESGIETAESLVKNVARRTEPAITISCGVSYWSSSEAIGVKKLFNRADEALYVAKKSGKNKVTVHESYNLHKEKQKES
ncbi:diguanylate cyclase (GGDEF)-like protein [Bacillus ectoiniformans]|uniref:sensor domain-containing diguanylate cyclase n=1 Tax=Bacillus ectoiniformans TaxID=1494429 RepID=UPI00195EE17D|nr:sensor domain-containing diguanylate cyclase [Bacillus ectoiniformans]MBM7648804.1 diguanylate cyclase (GGDEF)-like protein [Bacillus ectoiniformans]